jgi:ABC-type transporter Mla subunit MlaD
MKEQRINAAIAITTVVAAIIMVFALSFAIGKWSLGSKGHTIIVRFPNASGITPNSEVKYAGASSGRVTAVRLIARADQTLDPVTKQFNCVEVVLSVDPKLELGQDVVATIKQDGFGISAKYVLLTPGPDHNSPDLADNAVIQGSAPFDLGDLIQPAGEALTQAKSLVNQLQPILARLDTMTQKLGPMVDHGDKFLQDGDAVMANLSTQESRDRINTMLASLSVATENLKVVSSNAKALTATLAQKPWRVFWGGSTVTAPPENEVLKSNSVIKLKPDVEVTGAAADTAAKKPTPQP